MKVKTEGDIKEEEAWGGSFLGYGKKRAETALSSSAGKIRSAAQN